jgi:hypothetical protein
MPAVPDDLHVLKRSVDALAQPGAVRMTAITIRRLIPDDLQPGARLLATSMRDNPLHRAVFGGENRDVEDLAARAFERLLARLLVYGQILGGFEVVATRKVLGVANWFMLRRPIRFQPAPTERAPR